MKTDRPKRDTIWVLVDDLFFSARIRTTAASLGRELVLIVSPATLADRSPEGVSMLILDLNARTFNALAFLRSVKSDPRFSTIPVVGYFSHVGKEIRREAEQLGIDRLLTKSEFTKRLPELLETAKGTRPEPE